MLNELKSKLKELAELRRDIKNSEEYIAERKAEYEATDAYKSYKKAAEAKTELQTQTTYLETEIKLLTNHVFVANGSENKHPTDGVQIKEFSIVEIKEGQENTAKDWAIKNAPSLVSVNMSKLMSAVKSLELPWVEKKVEYRAQIDSDLSQYLEE